MSSDWLAYKMKIEQLEQEVRALKNNPPENTAKKDLNASLISASKNLSQYVITEDGISQLHKSDSLNITPQKGQNEKNDFADAMKIKNYEDFKLEAPVSPKFHQAPPNNTTSWNTGGNTKSLAIDLEKITRSKSKNKENENKGPASTKAAKYSALDQITHIRNDSQENTRNLPIDKHFTLEK